MGGEVGLQARDVGHGGDGQQFGALQVGGEVGFGGIGEQGVGEDADGEADLRLQQLPGDDVGVVFGLGQHDAVGGGKVLAAPGLGDQVDAFGAVAGEDQFFWLGAEEGGERLAGGFERSRRFRTVKIQAPVDVGVGAAEGLGEGVDDHLGFVGGGGVIQERQALAVGFGG